MYYQEIIDAIASNDNENILWYKMSVELGKKYPDIFMKIYTNIKFNSLNDFERELICLDFLQAIKRYREKYIGVSLKSAKEYIEKLHSFYKGKI